MIDHQTCPSDGSESLTLKHALGDPLREMCAALFLAVLLLFVPLTRVLHLLCSVYTNKRRATDRTDTAERAKGAKLREKVRSVEYAYTRPAGQSGRLNRT